MFNILKIIASVFVFLMFMPAFSNAGAPILPMDHLKCYMVKDPLKVKEDVKLFSRQFGIEEDCKIIGKQRFFCGGVSKTVEPPSDFTPFSDAADRICYRIECPPGQGQNEVPGDTEVEDQFGIRTLSKFNPHYLCTPAFKTSESCEARAACGGTCIDENNTEGICQDFGTGQIQDCLCLPPPDVPCGQRGDSCAGPCFAEDTGAMGICLTDSNNSCAECCVAELEICDGEDNDCDGEIDEGCTDCSALAPTPDECGGTCATDGTNIDGRCFPFNGQECTCGMCLAEEDCGDAGVGDGLDNDCNGLIDDGCPVVTPVP